MAEYLFWFLLPLFFALILWPYLSRARRRWYWIDSILVTYPRDWPRDWTDEHAATLEWSYRGAWPELCAVYGISPRGRRHRTSPERPVQDLAAGRHTLICTGDELSWGTKSKTLRCRFGKSRTGGSFLSSGWVRFARLQRIGFVDVVESILGRNGELLGGPLWTIRIVPMFPPQNGRRVVMADPRDSGALTHELHHAARWYAGVELDDPDAEHEAMAGAYDEAGWRWRND